MPYVYLIMQMVNITGRISIIGFLYAIIKGIPGTIYMYFLIASYLYFFFPMVAHGCRKIADWLEPCVAVWVGEHGNICFFCPYNIRRR